MHHQMCQWGSKVETAPEVDADSRPVAIGHLAQDFIEHPIS